MKFHLFSAHHLVNGGSSKMILIHTIPTDVIQIPPFKSVLSTNTARTSAKTHLFEQSLLSGRVQHKLVKAGVG